MFAMYNALNLHVSASNRDVIRAINRSFSAAASKSTNPDIVKRRKKIYRSMIKEHKDARDLFSKYRF